MRTFTMYRPHRPGAEGGLMTDKPAESAVERYREWHHDWANDDGANWDHGVALADDALAELQAEVESLKCCGNCGHLHAGLYKLCETKTVEGVLLSDPCHFTPSRWKRRES